MTELASSSRDRILAAAEELFAERGYARTSTARLATTAGVPQGLIFYHFGTKEGLLLALIRERSTRTLADLVPEHPPADPRAAVAELWTRLAHHLGEQTPMHRIMFRESEHHAELQARAREIYDSMTDTITFYLARATGHSRPSARHRTAAGMLVAAAAASSVAPGGSRLTAKAVANLLLDGLD